MKRIINITALLLSFVITFSTSPANDKDLPYFGLLSNFNLNMNGADFKTLPDVPNCCPQFDNGSGTGLSFGGLYQYPIFEKFNLGLRFVYLSNNVSFKSTEPTWVSLNNQAVQGEFKYQIDASLSEFAIEPVLGYEILEHFYINFGLSASFILSASYDQYEEITRPSDAATFLDENFQNTYLRRRHELSGDIDNVNTLQFAMLPGLSASFPMNADNTLQLCPEIYYSLPLGDVVDGITWSSDRVRFGLAIKFYPFDRSKPEPIERVVPEEPKPEPDDIVIADNKPEANEQTESPNGPVDVDIDALAVVDEKEEKLEKLVIEEFLSESNRPLLNFIFFDDGQSAIPDRYNMISKNATGDFNENQLFDQDRLGTYYHILNIIGSRLKNNPDQNITLVGCNSENGPEKDNMELSRTRAVNVKDYLVRTWNIDAGRIEIEARGLPEKPTPTSHRTGEYQEYAHAENRRVEIISSAYEILKPIFVSDTLRTANPPCIRFKPKYDSEYNIIKAKLTVGQMEYTLREYEADKEPATQYDWFVSSDRNTIPRLSRPINYSMYLKNSAGHNYITNDKYIPVEQRTIEMKREQMAEDKEFFRFSLILFDFGSNELSKLNARIMKIVRSKVRLTDRVTILGYTDLLGDEQFNLDFSKKRADAVKKAMLIHDSQVEKVIGRGEHAQNELGIDNSLPEGRFYSRTVDIDIQRPVIYE